MTSKALFIIEQPFILKIAYSLKLFYLLKSAFPWFRTFSRTIESKRNARIQDIDFIEILELKDKFYRAFCLVTRHIAR
jgi:hypothetical protein